MWQGSRFGQETDTGDITGQPKTSEGEASWASSRVEAVLPEFLGRQWQVPPQFSAKRIEGKRAYDLARAGEEVELPPREIHVYDISVIPPIEQRELTLKVICGAGTYIRSLAQDIARKAGTRACLSALRRISLGNLLVADAWSLYDLRNSEGWLRGSTSCLEAGSGLPWPRLTCSSKLAKTLGHGQVALLNKPEFSLAEGEKALAISPEGNLLGVLASLESSSGPAMRVKAVKWLGGTS